MFSSALYRFRSALSVPHRLTGLALLRICFGFVSLINQLSHFHEYRFLWGDEGMMPYGIFMAQMRQAHCFSLYALSPAPSFHVAVYCLQIAVTAAFILGWKTTWVTPLFALCNWSLAQRNWLLLDGGDNLMYLLSFWLIFTRCGDRLSLDEQRQTKPQVGPYRALVHNMALVAMIVQLMLLYGTSAMAKLTGPTWQHGTAIYYVMRTGEFNLSPLTPYLWKYGVVVALLTYSVMIFQVLWPILIWTRSFKLPVAVGAVLLHGSIGYFMGLTWFSMVMIGAEAIMFSDTEFSGYVRKCTQTGLWLGKSRSAARKGADRQVAA